MDYFRVSVWLMAVVLCFSSNVFAGGVYGDLVDGCSTVVKERIPSHFRKSGYREREYRQCKDGSVSFNQPGSEGAWGWEGKCGETAIANTLRMTCAKTFDPSGYMDDYNSDWGPGTHPETMETTLNHFGKSCGTQWSYYNVAKNRREFIESLVSGLRSPSEFVRTRENGTKIRRAPIPVLVYERDLGTFHWVTVVDIYGYQKNVPLRDQAGCRVIVNQVGSQYNMKCNDLAFLAEEVDSAYGVAGWYLGRFVRLKQI